MDREYIVCLEKKFHVKEGLHLCNHMPTWKSIDNRFVHNLTRFWGKVESVLCVQVVLQRGSNIRYHHRWKAHAQGEEGEEKFVREKRKK